MTSIKQTKTTRSTRPKLLWSLLATVTVLVSILPARATNIAKADNNNNLNAATSWTNGVVPGTADTAIFDFNVVTPASATNILGGNLAWNTISVSNPAAPVQISADGSVLTNNTSIDLSGASQDLTLNCALVSGNTLTWNVASGRTLTINSNLTGTKDLYKTGAGTLNFSGGTVTAPTAIGQLFAQNGNINVTGYLNTTNKFIMQYGGTINWSGVGDANGSYYGVADGTGGTNNITGGTLTVSPSSGVFIANGAANITTNFGVLNVSGGLWQLNKNVQLLMGSGYNNTAGGQGIINISGAGTLDTAASTGLFQLGNNGGAATINLNGGTLSTLRSITRGTTGNGGLATNNFNGGTLKANGANATFMGGLTRANVRNGGAIINDGGFAITIAQPLLHSGIAGDNTTDGGLTKLGTGTNTLIGANTYNGPTVVQQGRLGVSTASTGGGSYSVANGATLHITNAAAGQTLVMSSLTMGTTGASTLEFDSGTLANPTAAIANAAALVLNGTVTVSVYGSGLSAGTYTLLNYNGNKSGSGSFVLGTLPAGVSGTLTDTGTLLQFTVFAGLTWQGYVGNVWDINNGSDLNWTNLVGHVAAYYNEVGGHGPVVTFDDSAAGNPAVTLGVTVSPASVIFSNNALSYSLTGAGKISGGANLIKNNKGTVTLNTSNDFSGGIALNAGTLALGPGTNLVPNTTVAFGASATLSVGAGSLALASVTVPFNSTNLITGAGATLTLNSAGFNLSESNAVLNMSGLGNFIFNQPAYDFQANGYTNGVTDIQLAMTNTITANNLEAGEFSTQNSGNLGQFDLGQVNNFNVVNFAAGGYKTSGTFDFQAGLVNPKLTLRGQGGGTTLAGSLYAGYNNTGAFGETGTMNFGSGTIDLMVTNLYVAYTVGGSAVTGNLIMGAGSVVASNLEIGFSSQGTPTLTGNFTQNGGTVNAQNMIFGTSTISTPTMTSSYNLNGGLLEAQMVAPGTNVGGNFTNKINWTGGTIQNFNANTPLLISNVNIAVVATNAGCFFTVSAGLTNTLFAAVALANATNAVPVVMNGPGTLDLQGTTDNPYFALNVSNGVVLLDKVSSGTPSVHAIGSGLTLNGGKVVLAGSGGDQIADLRIVTLNSGTFDLSGQSETIGGLAGSGGVLTDSVGGSQLTVSVAAGTNYTCSTTITGGNLVFGGLGTQIFTGTDSRTSGLGLSTSINEGALQIGNGGSAGNLAGDSVGVNSPGELAFDLSGMINYPGTIYGNGDVAQSGSGTLILSGSDSHSGNTWINSGTLAVPTGGTAIGGTVITIAAGATLDVTGGAGNFMLNNGQTLTGAGSVTGSFLASTGATNSGNMVINGSVTMLDSSVLNPGGLYTAGTITVNGNFTNSGNNSLIYNLSSISTPGSGVNSLLVVSGNLDLGDNFNTPTLIIQGTPASGTYVIATFGTFSGNVSALTVAGSSRYTFTPQIVGHQLQLVVAGTPAKLVWTGDGVANAWDSSSSDVDWYDTTLLAAASFNPGDLVQFNDLSTNLTVSLNATVLPSSVIINAATNNYTWVDGSGNGSGAVGGLIGMTKTNAAMLTIQNNNTFTGPFNLNGGVVSVGTVALNGTAQPLGEGSTLAFNGGAFQYTGAAVPVGGFNRAITLGANGGTFDQENGTYFFLTNQISGSGSFTKVGPSQLIIGDTTAGTGNNTYSGITYVTNGQVQLRNTNALGSTSGKTVITDPGNVAAGGGLVGTIAEPFDLSGYGGGNGALEAEDGGTTVTYAGNLNLVANASIGSSGTAAFTISGNISGAGELAKLSGNTIILLGTNTYAGGTTISNGLLQVGSSTVNNTLPGSVNIAAGTLSMLVPTNQTAILPGPIHGAGTLYVNNEGGTVSLTSSNDWTGPVTINAGSVWINNSSGLGIGPKTITVNNGTAGHPSLHLNGTNGNITLDPSLSFNTSWVGGTFYNEAGSNTIPGQITMTAGGGDTAVYVNSGTLNLAGIIGANTGSRNLDLYGASNGIISGTIVDTLGAVPLGINVDGPGIWDITGTNASAAPINVNSGTLQIDGAWAGLVRVAYASPFNGTLGGVGVISNSVSVLAGGTLSPGDGVGTLTIVSNLTLSGNLYIEVNKALTQSNDLIVVTGGVTNTAAGTITMTNLNSGVPLTVGDSFTLFNQPVVNGQLLTVTGGGMIWTNQLALNGSISILSVQSSVNPNPTNITAKVSGGTLQLSWPADHTGWRLLVQTNHLAAGISANTNDWMTVPGSAQINQTNILMDSTKPTEFYRLVYP